MLTTIRNSELTAVIDSTGAQLVSLKDRSGKEYIWQRDPRFWDRCSPLLFPVVGGCRDNRIVIDGSEYSLPKHGFCKDMEFHRTTRTDCSVSFLLQDSEYTKTMYPWSFCLSLTYELQHGSLLLKYRVANKDSSALYYCIGAHPGFCCPMEEDAVFEDYFLVFEKEESTYAMPFDRLLGEYLSGGSGYELHGRVIPLSRELFQDNALYFPEIASRRVSLVHRESGRGVEVSYPDFETIAFWTVYPDRAPFLCIEPWNGSGARTGEGDELIHKNHVRRLEPGASHDLSMAVRPLISRTETLPEVLP